MLIELSELSPVEELVFLVIGIVVLESHFILLVLVGLDRLGLLRLHAHLKLFLLLLQGLLQVFALLVYALDLALDGLVIELQLLVLVVLSLLVYDLLELPPDAFDLVEHLQLLVSEVVSLPKGLDVQQLGLLIIVAFPLGVAGALI